MHANLGVFSRLVDKNRLCHIWLPRTHHADPDEQIPRHSIRLGLAVLVHSVIDRRAIPGFGGLPHEHRAE